MAFTKRGKAYHHHGHHGAKGGGGMVPLPFPNQSPAGISGQVQPLSKRLGPIGQGFYHWDNTKLPNPGVQPYAFTNNRVVYQPLALGVAFKRQYKSMQPPQLYIAGQAVVTTGFGGINNGPLIFQPLIQDPFA